MKLVSAAIAAAFCLTSAGCKATGSELPQPVCSPFDKVDRARISTNFESWTAPPALPTEWQNWSVDAEGAKWPAHQGRAPQLRIQVTDHDFMTGTQFTYDILGARQQDGWVFQRRRSLIRPPTGPAADLEEIAGTWEPFEPSRKAIDSLEQRLRDPCLWSSPPFLDENIPLVGGGEARNHHFPWTFYDLRVGGRQFGGVYAVTFGQPGDLMLALMEAAYPDADLSGVSGY